MSANELPTWIRYLQALTTPALAFLGIVIAWAQYSLATARMRHDLYDRRYKLFEAARNLLAEIVRDADCTYNQIFEFLRNTGDAVFILDPTVVAYFETLKTNAFELVRMKAIFNDLANQNRNAAIDRHGELVLWFSKQFDVLVDQFKPFLQLERSWAHYCGLCSRLFRCPRAVGTKP